MQHSQTSSNVPPHFKASTLPHARAAVAALEGLHQRSLDDFYWPQTVGAIAIALSQNRSNPGMIECSLTMRGWDMKPLPLDGVAVYLVERGGGAAAQRVKGDLNPEQNRLSWKFPADNPRNFAFEVPVSEIAPLPAPAGAAAGLTMPAIKRPHIPQGIRDNEIIAADAEALYTSDPQLMVQLIRFAAKNRARLLDSAQNGNDRIAPKDFCDFCNKTDSALTKFHKEYDEGDVRGHLTELCGVGLLTHHIGGKSGSITYSLTAEGSQKLVALVQKLVSGRAEQRSDNGAL